MNDAAIVNILNLSLNIFLLRSFAFGSIWTLTTRSLTKVLPSSSWVSVPRALLANIFFNSTSYGRRSSSQNCDDFALQSKIRRNSARKEGFMPAYINGFIVLEKNIKKGQSSWILRGTTSEAKRCIITAWAVEAMFRLWCFVFPEDLVVGN